MRAFELAVELDGAAQPPVGLQARCAFFALTLTFYLSGAAATFALDGSNNTNPPQKISPETFTSAQEALRAGVDDLENGDAQSSVRALTYAAEGGEPLARWKLGSLYAAGELVPRDDLRAYKYFEQLIESYNQDEVEQRDLGAVSAAFVAVGVYSLNGIANSEIKPDPERALEMFQVAATDFGDPEAQYRLARMYIDGAAGLPRDNMRAARWLALAAEKGHCGAEALLGHLLFTGDGVPRQKARGLMWLAAASNGAKSAKDAWIRELHAKDLSAASDEDREMATLYLNARAKESGEVGRPGVIVRALRPSQARIPGAGPMVVSAPPPAVAGAQ